MKLAPTCIVLPLLLTNSLSAAGIVGELNFSNETIDGMPSLGGVITTPIGIASVSWDFAAVDSDTFEFQNTLAASGFQAFQVPFESLLGPANIPTSVLVANNFNEPVSNFDIPDGGSIFLAHIIASDAPPEFRAYGWIELENNGGVLTSGGSAIAMRGLGIIVGTTTTIPEPSSTALSMFLLLPFFKRKRCYS